MRSNPTCAAILVATALPAQKPEAVQAAVDVIVALASTSEQRGAAFSIVRDAEFALVAGPLVRAMETCRVRRGPNFAPSGIGPSTETPWLETGARLEDRIDWTLYQVWKEHTRRIPWQDALRTMLEVVEDGRGGDSRSIALSGIPSLREAATVMPDVRERLEKVAAFDRSPWIRARACALLTWGAEAPEKLIDLAFQIAAAERRPLYQGDLLVQTGILAVLPRMSPAGRRVLLERSFALMHQIDNGAGAGSSLGSAIARDYLPLATDAEPPEQLIDLTFHIAGLHRQPRDQGDLLVLTRILDELPRMSAEGRRRLLERSFALLRQIDDGKGAGAALAAAIGKGLGIVPVATRAVPFSPDPEGYPRNSPVFHQTTVCNALAWYEKHKDD